MAKEKKQLRELSDEELKDVTGGLGGFANAQEPQCDSFTCGEGQSVYISTVDGHCYCGEAETSSPQPRLHPIE